MGRMERGGQVVQKAGKRPRQRLRPRDENIVIAPNAIKGKERRSGGPKPPFGPVALDGPTDLPAGRKSHTQGLGLRSGLGRPAQLQRHRWDDLANASGRAEKVWTGLQPFHDEPRPAGRLGQAESLLRPWARRRASTLR